ncbi:hypothetical protein ACFSR7_05755 [Cohnella sp. GCM10020058]|uniref:hypothetical protein n=1 Tax=Cohnella sp. GCM10020058 TaxID=3317330 RepID=UPI0036451367
MAKEETKVINGGRIALAIVMILFGVFCVVVLTKGFTIWFLLLALAGVGGGIFNLVRALGKRQRPAGKTRAGKGSSSDDFSL